MKQNVHPAVIGGIVVVLVVIIGYFLYRQSATPEPHVVSGMGRRAPGAGGAMQAPAAAQQMPGRPAGPAGGRI